MKMIISGSLGNISKPLAIELLQKGHSITVISSKPEKQKEIEDLGATAAIGLLDDVVFLTRTFTGADIVYCMVPPNYMNEPDIISYYQRLGKSYVQAIRQSGVQKVIHLSSYGAHLEEGSGLILGSHHVEVMLGELPGISVTHMRPAYFYYNLYSFTGMIKHTGMIAANYGGNHRIVMVSPVDIAAAIAAEAETMINNVSGRNIRYVASDELTGNEIAQILGAAIGKPALEWKLISNEQMQQGLESNGVPSSLAAKFIDMFASLQSGALTEDYYRHQPAKMGTVKLSAFAKEFATTFNKQ